MRSGCAVHTDQCFARAVAENCTVAENCAQVALTCNMLQLHQRKGVSNLTSYNSVPGQPPYSQSPSKAALQACWPSLDSPHSGIGTSIKRPTCCSLRVMATNMRL